MKLSKPGTALIAVDDVADNLQFVVRRDHRIVAAFAKRTHAIDWAQQRSWNDESAFAVQAAGEVVETFRDGEAESGEQ